MPSAAPSASQKAPPARQTWAQPLGRGRIGLQFNEGKVEFKNVKLKPLNLKTIFNGRDLAGWQSFGGDAPPSSWTVRDGTLVLTKAYADWSADVKTIKTPVMLVYPTAT